MSRLLKPVKMVLLMVTQLPEIIEPETNEIRLIFTDICSYESEIIEKYPGGL